MKTLYPKAHENAIGQSVFVDEDEHGHWLCFKTKERTSNTAISEEFYEAFLKESKKNYKVWNHMNKVSARRNARKKSVQDKMIAEYKEK